MSFPMTIPEMKAAGWCFIGSGDCQGRNCGAPVEWWMNPEHTSTIPFDVDAQGGVTPHLATCPNAEELRGFLESYKGQTTEFWRR